MGYLMTVDLTPKFAEGTTGVLILLILAIALAMGLGAFGIDVLHALKGLLGVRG